MSTETEIVRQLEKVLGSCDDLRRKPWRGHTNPVAGHCYVVSEVLYHLLGGKTSSWKPMNMRVGGVSHWFLKHKTQDRVLDPTAGQFPKLPDHSAAIGRGFLTRKPSKRARILLERYHDSNPVV